MGCILTLCTRQAPNPLPGEPQAAPPRLYARLGRRRRLVSQDAVPRGVPHGDGAYTPSPRKQAACALPIRRGRGCGVVAGAGKGGGGGGGREGGEGGGRGGGVGRWGLGSSPSGA